MMNFQGVRSPLSSTINLHTSEVGVEELAIVGKRTDEILSMVQPTEVSDCRRRTIIEYIQMITEATYGIKVFAFGSVPLKTYLPDGDIDLTAFCPCDDETLVNIFIHLLECIQNSETVFHVTNIRLIPAQVKVVKCCVDNISVDISFNQIAGLCTLSFLEQVNELIGEDHLFRRSVILLKAWCHYESRTLGANHGLISTYALETMAVLIFNLFRSSLHCPLDVLYRFLQYYSNFNWDVYCLTINGPTLISALPDVFVGPSVHSGPLIITNEILHNFQEAYIHSMGMMGMNISNEDTFRIKYLNVMDPLREGNNLGLCVSQGNFLRIKRAFCYGFKTLQQILTSPLENLHKGVDKFFKTVVEHHMNVGREENDISPTNMTLHGGSCSTAELSTTEFPPLQVKASMKTNQGNPSINAKESSSGAFKWREVVVSSKSSPSTSVNSPMKDKADETQTQPSPQEQEEILEAKPAKLIDMNEFPSFSSPNHGESLRVPNELPSSSSGIKNVNVESSSESSGSACVILSVPMKAEESQLQSSPQNQEDIMVAKAPPKLDMKDFPCIPSHGGSSGVEKLLTSSSSVRDKKATDGSKGRDKGAWNKPLLQKATTDNKGKDIGAWKVPLIWKSIQKDQPKK